MKNYVQEGDVVTVAAPTGGISSGDGVLVGALFGVAATTAAAADPVALATVGVFSLPKRLSASFASGAVVAWTVPEAYVDVVAAGRYPIGVATEPAGAGTSAVNVRLNGVATAAA